MEKKKKDKKKSKKIRYFEGIGRRKTATARVRLYPLSQTKKKVEIWEHQLKPGVIIVNKKPVEEYFPGELNKIKYIQPFKITNTLNKFAATIQVSGSGKKGQLEAVTHGVARALEKYDKEEYRPILKEKGFLTRDPRMKERRKAGLAQSARAKKQSPKR